MQAMIDHPRTEDATRGWSPLDFQFALNEKKELQISIALQLPPDAALPLWGDGQRRHADLVEALREQLAASPVVARHTEVVQQRHEVEAEQVRVAGQLQQVTRERMLLIRSGSVPPLTKAERLAEVLAREVELKNKASALETVGTEIGKTLHTCARSIQQFALELTGQVFKDTAKRPTANERLIQSLAERFGSELCELVREAIVHSIVTNRANNWPANTAQQLADEHVAAATSEIE